MANNNDDKNNNSNTENDRRQHHRPEDNPFIAFRRFADSQVSSLLNTVFTLPATLANYNNAHQAREQCLFGKADQRQCDRLHEIEAHIAELRNEGREFFRMGDVHGVLRNSEELMRLDRRADDIRRDILRTSNSESETQPLWPNETELVERVANRKGQEWGWAWDWGFPRPFDHERRSLGDTSEEQDAKDFMALDRLLRMQAEASRLAQEFDDKAWDDSAAHRVRFDNCSETQLNDGKPRVWSWSKSWQWPPRPGASQSDDDDTYLPRALEQNRALDRAGIPWRAAYEDLLRTEQIPISQQQLAQNTQQNGEPKCLSGINTDAWWFQPATQQQLGESMQRDEEPRCPPLAPHDEPSYEYSHDHEDQHDDPPTPKRNQFPSFNAFRQDTATHSDREAARFENYAKEYDDPATEMDAYERLDAASANTDVSAAPAPCTSVTSAFSEKKDEPKSSLLSTLTTTERTVAPDGSVITKVLLKKRFADGREESTETVHTQRGRENDLAAKDPWEALKNSQSRSSEAGDEPAKKRSGWFWSS